MPSWWFEGTALLGQCNWLRTGCWMLVHGREAAVLEMPPHDRGEPGPAELAAAVAQGLEVKYLLCSHAHPDHFSLDSFEALRRAFPNALPVLHEGFARRRGFDAAGVRLFAAPERLELAGEPLHLLPAPKHSPTDTMVLFRGACCTGDWELGTLRSVHDGKPWGVPWEDRVRSVAAVRSWLRDRRYRVHGTYSAHANDKRERIDFDRLMESTGQDRPL